MKNTATIPCPQGVTPDDMIARRDHIVEYLEANKIFDHKDLTELSSTTFMYIINLKDKDTNLSLEQAYGSVFAREITKDIMARLLIGAYSI